MTTTTRLPLVVCSLLILARATATLAVPNPNAGSRKNGAFVTKDARPDLASDQPWVSFHRTVSFLPNPDLEEDAAASVQARHMARQLEQEEEATDDTEDDTAATTDDDVYRVSPFVESYTDYDADQQAWRLLGFMIDCDDDLVPTDDDEHNSGSGDNEATEQGCHRYVLWAAYVDLEYEGGGIGEYQYWDVDSQSWDATSCNYGDAQDNGGSNDYQGDGTRCAKMDCHLEDTHWSLLGYFKHKSYDDWMEQLFKHEGVCVWSDDEYSFMKNARKVWPEQCSVSSYTTSDGNPVYYDLKPVKGGGIALGLYTDTRCVVEYQSTGRNDPINAENVLSDLLENNSGSGSGDQVEYEASTFQSYWDASFERFQICQPCTAYDLNNVGYNVDDDASRGSSYGSYYSYDDYYGYNYDQNDFDCYDDAGYTNVNQCMKFRAKTTMNTATFRDLSLASRQGTLVGNPLAQYASSLERRSYYRHQAVGTLWTYLFFVGSLTVLVLGIRHFTKVSRQPNFTFNAKEPLVFA